MRPKNITYRIFERKCRSCFSLQQGRLGAWPCASREGRTRRAPGERWFWNNTGKGNQTTKKSNCDSNLPLSSKTSRKKWNFYQMCFLSFSVFESSTQKIRKSSKTLARGERTERTNIIILSPPSTPHPPSLVSHVFFFLHHSLSSVSFSIFIVFIS